MVLGVLCGLISAALIYTWFATRSNTTEPDAFDVVVSPRSPSDDPCAYPQPTDRDLDETEAVASAECFVIQNGYTDLPSAMDKSKITPENVYPMTDEFGMQMRHDSLERQAVTVTRDIEFWGGSWIVMFRMRNLRGSPDQDTDLAKAWGRAVVMDFYGKNIRIQHSPYPMMRPGARIIAR